MIGLGEVWLTRPLWLLALPAIAALVFWGVRRRRNLAGWSRAIEAQFVPVLEALGHIIPARGYGAVPMLGAIAAITALALTMPSLRKDDAPVFRNLDVIVLLIDMSESVTGGDGLDDAQAAAARILAEADGRPVALALYAGEAYLVSGPTEDPLSLETVLGVLDGETMPDRGSRPDRALALALQMLGDASARNADVILISDGGGVGPDALHQAELLRGEIGARVSALFVGTEQAAYGAPPADRASLERLVAVSDGALADADSPGAVFDRLARSSDAAARNSELTALLYEDYGRMVLLLALFPALMLFRRRRAR